MNTSMDRTISALTERIRSAVTDGTPLRFRGGGSKDFYGHLAPGEMLETTGLRGILAYEPSELVITVGAGTPLDELEAVLADKGQCLAFEPPHFAWSHSAVAPARSAATVGGMVAAGLSGPSRANAGGVRDYVLGLHLVNGRGERLQYGGQVMKNVAGYDMSRMMVGSMGTLGLITQVSLKVLPVAPAEATLVFSLDQSSALDCLHRWGGQPLPLNASCWVHDNTATAAAGQDLLFVRLRGAVAAVEAAAGKMLAEVTGQRMDNAQAMADWELCRNQQLPFFARPADPNLALWRLSVAQTAPVLDLPSSPLIEWHGGLRWLWAPLEAGPTLQAQAVAHGGNATVFVAPCADSTRARGQFDTKDPALMTIQQRLKASLDPQGIFNPRRLFDAW
jgi:glycolate oxidase FAD binding subunit